MGHRIARWLFEPLLGLLLPGTGRRRQPDPPRGEYRPSVTAYLHSPIARPPWERPVRGEDTQLVRPYLVVHEQRQEARRQRARRRALRLAVHGIDVGPRVLHGVEVTA